MHSPLEIALKLLPQLLGETWCMKHQLEKQQGEPLQAGHIDAVCSVQVFFYPRAEQFTLEDWK